MRDLSAASDSSGRARCPLAIPAVGPADEASRRAFLAGVYLSPVRDPRRVEIGSDRPSQGRLRSVPQPATRAGIHQLDSHFDRISRIVGTEDLGIGIALAEVIDAVKNVLGAPIPELAMIEDSVDCRWSVARLDPTGVCRADEKTQRIGLVTRVVDPLRRHNVVAVGGRIESAANAWIGEPGQREA